MNDLPNISDSYINTYNYVNISLIEVESLLSCFDNTISKNIIYIDIINHLLTSKKVEIEHNLDEYKDMFNETFDLIKREINMVALAIYFSDENTNKYYMQSISFDLIRIKKTIHIQMYAYNNYMLYYKLMICNDINKYCKDIIDIYPKLIEVINKIEVY